MAVFRVREYPVLGVDANGSALPLTMEPAPTVTEIDTGSGAIEIVLQDKTRFLLVELWSGTSTHIKYDFKTSSPDVTSSTAGKAPIELTSVAFCVAKGLTVEFQEST